MTNGDSKGNLAVDQGKRISLPKVSIEETSWYIGRVHLDARPVGTGKTTEATEKLTKLYDFSRGSWARKRRREEELSEYPPATVNLYIAPTNRVKKEVFNGLPRDRSVVKGRDSRFFSDLLGKEPEKANKETFYRKWRRYGKNTQGPLMIGLFGRNSFMYTLLVARTLVSKDVDHVINVYLDDFVPNIKSHVMPIKTINEKGEEEGLRYKEVENYYNNIARKILLDIEKHGISPKSLREEQLEYVHQMASAALRFLLYWPEPIYLTKRDYGPWVFEEERIRRFLVFGDGIHIGSPEDYYATLNFLRWLLNVQDFSVITPAKPKSFRSLSAILEVHAEGLLQEVLKVEFLIAGIRGVPWATEALNALREGKTFSLGDVATNALFINGLATMGMNVHVLNGTFLTEAAGFIHHNGRAYLFSPNLDDNGRFDSWSAKEVISYNDQTLERDPVGGRDDVTITLDGVTGFPTLEAGARTVVERTGVNLYSVRMSLERSTILPIASVERIVIPKPRGRITRLVERDLERKIGQEEAPDSFSWFIRRVKGAGSDTLVKNLNIISKSIRFQQDYEKTTRALGLERMLGIQLGEEEERNLYLGIYASLLLSELIQRYASTPEETRLVVDPKILLLVKRTPTRWVSKMSKEVEAEFEVLSKYLNHAIAQNSRGTSDHVVLKEKARVIWITAVDPLYEESPWFRHFVGLSEINQTLGRFVHRGEGTAKAIDLVILGSGPSSFTLRSIVSAIDIIREVKSEEEMVPVIVADDLRKGLKRRKYLVRRCGHTYEDIVASQRAKARKEWLDNAQPEEVLTRNQARTVDEILAQHKDDPKQGVLAVLDYLAQVDGEQRLIGPEWYSPGFDDRVKPFTNDQIRAKMLGEEPKSMEEVVEAMRKNKEREARARERYVRALKETLAEDYNIGTSISSPEALKEILYSLEEFGTVPPKYRRNVWDLDGGENPYIDYEDY